MTDVLPLARCCHLNEWRLRYRHYPAGVTPPYKRLEIHTPAGCCDPVDLEVWERFLEEEADDHDG